jgi:Ankyrin repeats (3 copies)
VLFGAAAAEEQVSIIKLLINDHGVNPFANEDLALQQASSNGHASVVELLLCGYRADPT